MATIDKEQRARRKQMKILHLLNQQVKKIYGSYVIFDNGMILGNLLVDKSGNSKERFRHGYYKSDTIVSDFPLLSNVCLDSQKVFVAFRDDKPEKLYEKGNKLYLKGEAEEPWQIGFVMSNDLVEKARVKVMGFVNDVANILKEKDATMVFTDDMVERLIGYEKITPKFYDKDEYAMYLTISEFPFLKNFKNCTVIMRDTSSQYFDVVYITGNNTEHFSMRRRFLKLRPIEEVTKG